MLPLHRNKKKRLFPRKSNIWSIFFLEILIFNIKILMELTKRCYISEDIIEMLKEVFGIDYSTLIHQERVMKRTTFIDTVFYCFQPLDWASFVAQLVKNSSAVWENWVWSLGWEDPRRSERLPTPVFSPREFHGLYSP